MPNAGFARATWWIGCLFLAADAVTRFVSPSAASVRSAPPVLTVRELRIVDRTGRTTASLGNAVDGSSPALLLYDRAGRVGAAVLVDSATGKALVLRGEAVRSGVDRSALGSRSGSVRGEGRKLL